MQNFYQIFQKNIATVAKNSTNPFLNSKQLNQYQVNVKAT